MPQRPQYPLTPEAKEAAKALVEAWNSGNIEQILEIYIQTGDGEENWLMFGTDFAVPRKSIFFELKRQKLVEFISQETSRIEIMLLEELRNAVESNFALPGDPQTMTAIGNIVYGNMEVKDGGSVQNAASIGGEINQQSMIQLANNLEKLLGDEVLTQSHELREAILDLKVNPNDEMTRIQKLGKVVTELGNNLQHLANTHGAIQAILLIAKFFQAI